jgi:hypothetical protein
MDAASSTRFIHLSGELLADADTSEANCQIRNKSASKLNSFQVQCSTNARTNNSVFKSRKNGADGNCSVTFGAGVTGLVIDTSNEDTLAADDLFCASITLLTGVEDLGVNLVAAALETTSGHKNEVVGFHGVSRAASATEHYWALGGWIAVNTLTEAQAFIETGFDGEISNLQGYISANTYTGSADLNARIEGADAITVTVGAGITGWVQNTASAAFTDTDNLNLSFVGGTSGSATVFHTVITVEDGEAGTLVEIGLATETDTAMSVEDGGIDLGLVTETDSALALARDQLISFAAEIDTSLSLSAVRAYALGLASETDTALAATPVKHLGMPVETDSALSLAQILTFPTETDTALSMRPVRSYALGLAEETDSALSITLVDGIAEALGLAAETDTALSVLQRIFGMAEETDEALALIAYITDAWPFDDLKPRHIGIHKIASVIGGGRAMTGREPTISSGAGFWRIVYGGIPVKTRTQIRLWRAMEIKFEGRGASIVIPIYDGKRAPWPGTPGGSLQATASAAVAAGATSIAIDATGLAELEAGMGFSAGHYYHRIQSISATVGDVYTCTIWPKTREEIAINAPLEFGQPIMRVRLADDDAMRLPLTHHKFGEGNITFIEDVP